MGPPNGNFHMPYETGVVAEWTGANAHAQNRGGLREALLVAAESAADEAGHAILRGSAPPGRVLRLHKRFETRTSPYCALGVEPVVNVGLPRLCLSGERPPLTLDDEQDVTTTVPASGTYAWHIGPSTRPFVGVVPGRKEAYALTCEAPDGAVLERLSLVVDRGQAVTLNIGCGARATTFADRRPVGGDPALPASSIAPTVNGVPVRTASAPKRKPRTRAQLLAACNRRAARMASRRKRAAARSACKRRYGKRA
jgi:hypothetical protein